jgi:hypothetical protein
MPDKNEITGRIRGEKKTPKELQRLAAIRAAAQKDFPPLHPAKLTPATTGLAAQIREARERRGLTWDGLAKLANVSDASTIRDIECGRDAKLSNLQAVAAALGLRLELVEV